LLEAIKANGFEEGKNIVIDYQNAQGDQARWIPSPKNL
jgi:putative ABC transport system substrate-binding protein